MIEDIQNIKTIEDAQILLLETEKTRLINKKKIMNTPFISLNTNKAGKITNIDKKHLTIDVERWQWEPIDISVESYKNYIEVDEDIQHSINDYLDTFDDERKRINAPALPSLTGGVGGGS